MEKILGAGAGQKWTVSATLDVNRPFFCSYFPLENFYFPVLRNRETTRKRRVLSMLGPDAFTNFSKTFIWSVEFSRCKGFLQNIVSDPAPADSIIINFAQNITRRLLLLENLILTTMNKLWFLVLRGSNSAMIFLFCLYLYIFITLFPATTTTWILKRGQK